MKKILIAASLMLCALVSYYSNLESDLRLYYFCVLGLASFLLAIGINQKFRPIWILILTVLTGIIVLGPKETIAFIVLGILIFSITLLSIKKNLKYILLIAVAIGLGINRQFELLSFVSPVVIAILSSFLMFRTYLLVRHTGYGESTTLQKFNYLFLFPNFFSPLFPILDFTTYSNALKKKFEDKD